MGNGFLTAATPVERERAREDARQLRAENLRVAARLEAQSRQLRVVSDESAHRARQPEVGEVALFEDELLRGRHARWRQARPVKER